MKFSTAFAAAILGMALAGQAEAARGGPDEMDAQVQAAHAPTFGQTLPPIGFVSFCAANPSQCSAAGNSTARLTMSGERWRNVYRINMFVNASVAPESDRDLYGEAEHWAYPTTAGDCEDYVLLKKRYLEELGFARSALLITVVLDEKNQGHAVLTLATDDGDFVLDNRNDRIRRWNEIRYTFLKRQSQGDPRAWVSLIRDRTIASGETGTKAR